ncbi:hypothetical protein [Arachidicoccus soli]|uniref:DUF3300 domain-containing protein n=1 Tax=Arachidicoccus soli TaxID=2341117 RepID=A0A386HM52_9BACT|nr:hypothetical protein [Arachidicoccus soli]AYD46977.1 hypothetical protein D6B99_04725 [Arachidicoccus soli]
MKKILIAFVILFSCLQLQKASAQLSLSINIGSQPAWGPVGYNYVQYYYLPDINCYYNVADGEYVYPVGNHWHFASRLPERYRDYDIYNSYKVVVNRNHPYYNNRYDRESYGRYRGRRGQPMIRDSRDERYYSHGNGHAYGHYHGDENKGHYKHGDYNNHGGENHGHHGDHGHGRGRDD